MSFWICASGSAGDVSMKKIWMTSGPFPMPLGASFSVTTPAPGFVSNHPSSRLRSINIPLIKTAVLLGAYGMETVKTVFTPFTTPEGTSNLGLGIVPVRFYINSNDTCNWRYHPGSDTYDPGYQMKKKTCPSCREDLPTSAFSIRNSSPDGFQHSCKKCHGEQKAEIRLRRRRFIWDYLLSHPCVDCGESDPTVLDFDHVRGTKIENVCTMLCRGQTLDRIKEEMDKCEVRCANCHRRITAKRGQTYKTKFGQIEM